MKYSLLFVFCWLLTQTVWADVELTAAQNAEMLTMVRTLNHAGLACRAAVIPEMLAEANRVTDRLKLPTKRPILITDLQAVYVGSTWFNVLRGTNWVPDTILGPHIFDPDIPRDQRLRALKICAGGYLANTNFEFGFESGKLCRITRMSEPNVEYYAHDLDKLVGKPSLIDTNGAYQLATQWLAAIDVDMDALRKLKWTVNQLHYRTRGATNYVTLPLFYVDFGTRHYPASGNLKAFDKPLVSVEILGTSKELQDLEMVYGLSLSLRPPILITNVLELVRTTDPPLKQLVKPPGVQTNSPSP